MYADGFSKFRFGGYGEMAASYMDYDWNWVTPQGTSHMNRATVSIPRFILAFDYKFSPKWVLSSEIEFEYGGTGAAREVEWYEENGEYETEIEKGGEVALEQFHISYLMNKHLNFRFGHMIVPVGLTNAHHEPAFVARVNYNGVKKFKGLRVGASFYYNQPSKNSSKPLRNQGEKYPLTIVTADAQYKSPNNNLIARGNIVYGHLGNSNALTKVNNNSSSASGYPNSTVAETAVSYAAEVGYNVGSFFSRKAPRIYPFVRYEYYNPMQSVEKGSNKLADRRLQKSVITAGLNYYALPNLVVKADYAHRIVGKGDYNSQNMVSVGIAYIGWFLSR